LRITGGDIRGRKLASPKASESHFLRPTSDRVREALFNILGSQVKESVVLDLYAGTGSLGLEALSRGASYALFVDQSPRSLQIIQRNIESCFPTEKAGVFRVDLGLPTALNKIHALSRSQPSFDLIFLDPPYEKNLAIMTLKMIDKVGILKPNGLVVVEERHNEILPDKLVTLSLLKKKRYGETGLWIYERTGRKYSTRMA